MSESNTHPPKASHWLKIAIGLLFLVGMGKLLFMLWAANKGLELGDEGNYMLGLADPYRHTYPMHGYLLNRILPIEYTIPTARLLRIVFELLGILVFTFGLHQYLKDKGSPKIPFYYLFAFTLGGAYLSIFSRLVSYNDIAYLLALCSTSMALLSYRQHINNWLRYLMFAGSLYLIWMCLLYKPPVTVILLPVQLLMGFIVMPGKKWSVVIRLLSAFVASALLALLSHILVYPDWLWVKVINDVAQVAALLNYRAIDLVGMYMLYDVIPMVGYSLAAIGGFYSLRALLKRFSINTHPENTDTIASLVALAFGLGLMLAWPRLIDLVMQPVFPFTWLVVAMLLLLMRKNFLAGQLSLVAKDIAVYALLALLPLFVLAGTNSYVSETVPSYWATWFAILAIWIWQQSIVPLAAHKAIIYVALLVLICSTHFTKLVVINPYGQAAYTTLLHQNIKLEGKDGIYVDAQTHRFVTEYLRTLYDFNISPGTPILGLGYTPMLVYLADGYSPGGPYYLYSDMFVRANCKYLTQLKDNEQEPVILMRSNIEDGLLACLRTNLNYPDEYMLAAAINDPYHNFNESETPSDGKLYIYIHR